MKIALIGGGNMGEAIVSAVLKARLAEAQDITVSDKDEGRQQHLKQKYNVPVTSDNGAAVGRSDLVILAVKPQDFARVAPEIRGKLKPSQLVLSILAGTRIDTLCSGLAHDRVVRAMPNAPAQIGYGIAVWLATPRATQRQKRWAASILGAMGKEICVDDESYLDMATAVSGSGPAYFYLFVEALVDAAVEIGLPRDIAEKLVLQTMTGSAHLLEKSGKTAAELRRMVTSPGGTTAEAIAQFEKGGFNELVKRAITAAYNRSKLLGK